MQKRRKYAANESTNTHIMKHLRKCFLTSKERNHVLKEAEYRCAKCNAKQSRAKGREVKLHVHHTDGIDWTGLIALIRKRLLSGKLEVLCERHHKERHRKRGE